MSHGVHAAIRHESYAMKCFVAFRLRPGLTMAEYEDWFKRVNVPAICKMMSVSDYHVWRIRGALGDAAPYDVIEEMEVSDTDAFEAELESVPEVKAMLGEWAERVVDAIVVYGERLPQS